MPHGAIAVADLEDTLAAALEEVDRGVASFDRVWDSLCANGLIDPNPTGEALRQILEQAAVLIDALTELANTAKCDGY